jgi:transposase
MRKIKTRPEVTRVVSPIPRRARQISDRQSAQLADDYRQGMKVGELAKKYGIHRVTVADHLAVHGIAKRTRGLDEAQVSDAAERYQAGVSLAVLGKEYGVSPTTVRQTLVRQGVTMRNTYEHLFRR